MVTAILDICLLGHGEPDPVALHVELGVESATERRNKPLTNQFLFLQALIMPQRFSYCGMFAIPRCHKS